MKNFPIYNKLQYLDNDVKTKVFKGKNTKFLKNVFILDNFVNADIMKGDCNISVFQKYVY